MENQFEYTVKIPIVTTNLKSNTIISSDLPKYAAVQMRGHGRALLRLMIFKEAKIVLDLNREIGKTKRDKRDQARHTGFNYAGHERRGNEEYR